MGTYINYTCSKCRTSLSDGYRHTTFTGGLGLPFIECPKCKTLMTTGLQPYSQFAPEKKVFYWFGAIVTATLRGLLVGFMISGMALYFIVGNDKVMDHMIYMVPLPLFLFGRQLWIYNKNIQIVEDFNTRRDWRVKL
jgi:hypothetical protein